MSALKLKVILEKKMFKHIIYIDLTDLLLNNPIL